MLRDDGAGQHGRVRRVEAETGLGHRAPGRRGFRLALRGERDVVPPGEQVLQVPRALAVTERDEGAGRAHWIIQVRCERASASERAAANGLRGRGTQ